MTKPIIYTSSWFATLPDTHLRVGVSRGVPRGMAAGFRRYTKLNPNCWFNSVSPQEYEKRYKAEVLDYLHPERVVDDLVAMAGGSIPTLCCFEAADEPTWCHRGLISRWLKERLDLDVYEFGHEHCGCGGSHPKLHPSQVRRSAP